MNHTNQLIHETSPYLLQHAHNPVNWLPYGHDAFAEASRLNKPLLISIGYSSCHWCHVMERETFEDESIAEFMNANFVCVKVDREERPDVDHVFMDAVQQVNGSGGWPLNCFALPDGRPFWGGTYFRPEQWKQLLATISDVFQQRFAELEKQASEIAEGVAMQNKIITEPIDNKALAIDFEPVLALIKSNFDLEKGGFKGAPKFPLPVVLKFLQLLGTSKGNATACNMVDLTLEKMACGGIYDQAGGGFARYSTDSNWKVPHFEKMLYDNAQLIAVYSKAWMRTGKVIFKETVEQSIEFINRELTAPEGVFYSALDADSEGREGLFYTWTQDQFSAALGHYDQLVGEYFAVGNSGLWEEDRNILLRTADDSLFAQQHFLSIEELTSLIGFSRAQLLKARSTRIRPALDDKMLVSWNSLMISALVEASVAFSRNEYIDNALRVANFITKHLKRKDGGLFHTWKSGKPQINAFLDDYAFTCDAFLKLYSVSADEHWLREAEWLIEYVVEHFYNSHTRFFWYSDGSDNHLFSRKIEIYDGVVPSGNSAIAHVLNTLGIFLQKPDYCEMALLMLKAMESHILRSPAAYSNWAALALQHSNTPFVVAVTGTEAVSVIKEIKQKSLSDALIFGTTKPSSLPYFAQRFVDGKTLIYLCTGTFCMPPVESAEEAIRLLAGDK